MPLTLLRGLREIDVAYETKGHKYTALQRIRESLWTDWERRQGIEK